MDTRLAALAAVLILSESKMASSAQGRTGTPVKLQHVQREVHREGIVANQIPTSTKRLIGSMPACNLSTRWRVCREELMAGEDPGLVEQRGRVEEEAGDARATSFEAIYRNSYSRLVGQLTMVTTSRVEAEDVVQEAFSRLWERWSNMQSYDNVEAWVRRVSLNAAIGHWRRVRRHVALTDVPSLDDPTGSDVAVLLALRRLPPTQRAALFLHHLVGLPVDDVAGELSAKTGTVKSWLHRGRASLEAQLRIQADEVNES